jgi:hypothetical protein
VGIEDDLRIEQGVGRQQRREEARERVPPQKPAGLRASLHHGVGDADEPVRPGGADRVRGSEVGACVLHRVVVEAETVEAGSDHRWWAQGLGRCSDRDVPAHRELKALPRERAASGDLRHLPLEHLRRRSTGQQVARRQDDGAADHGICMTPRPSERHGSPLRRTAPTIAQSGREPSRQFCSRCAGRVAVIEEALTDRRFIPACAGL